MRMREFIASNRAEIDESIRNAHGDNCVPTNDRDREDWVVNDEVLYNWAKAEGVPA